MSKEKVISLARKYRALAGPLIILAVLLVFWRYIAAHPDSLTPLKSLPLIVVPVLLILYCVVMTANALVTARTIAMNKHSYPFSGAMMLSAYSMLVNFFGPLQSGPGFRAVYLRKKLGLSIKGYTVATTLYYGAFTVINILMLLGLSQPLWTAVIIVMLAIVGFVVLRRQSLPKLFHNLFIIGLVTTLQIAALVAIYYLELQALGHTTSLQSALAYTASANLALFVALTPGAIGIRESFLYFTQSLHEVPNQTIIAASLLDRAVYLVFLGLLFVASSSLHLKSKFK